jgi:dolichol-phosphate mannosyltransferase
MSTSGFTVARGAVRTLGGERFVRSSAVSPDLCAGPWVVVPTYNEIDNVERVVLGLCRTLDGAVGGEYRILVVDDDSPDGTGARADRLAGDLRAVRVLHRSDKQGLGAAYAAGFAVALAGGATHVVQMDGDLSHDPAAVLDLIAACEDVDLAIGSRYVRGGSTQNWTLKRRLLSRAGCAYARRWLGLGVRDLTGGFKCWRADALAAIAVDSLLVEGYAFQIEMTYRAARNGCRIAELPICFMDREHGVSKMDGAIVREALVQVPRLRLASRSREKVPALQPSPLLVRTA